MELTGMSLNPLTVVLAQGFAVGMASVVLTFPSPSDLTRWIDAQPAVPYTLNVSLPDPTILPEGGCLSRPRVAMSPEARNACAGLLGAVFTEIDADPTIINQTWVDPLVEEIRVSALEHCRRVWATGGPDLVAQSASCRLATQDVAFRGDLK